MTGPSNGSPYMPKAPCGAVLLHNTSVSPLSAGKVFHISPVFPANGHVPILAKPRNPGKTGTPRSILPGFAQVRGTRNQAKRCLLWRAVTVGHTCDNASSYALAQVAPSCWDAR